MSRLVRTAVVGTALVWSQAALALSGFEVLKQMDAAEYAAKDSTAKVKVVLTDKGGARSERRMEMVQKGVDKRLIKFMEPADVKDVAFLDTGDDQMYLYLPAFHKVRKIAGHVKNDNFAGTDFAYEDLEAKEFSSRMEVTAMSEDAEHYLLECKPKPGTESQYSKLKIAVRKKDFLFDRTEFFDEKGNNSKLFTREDFRKVGTYTQSFLIEMKDLSREHSTQMIVESLQVDTGLKDSFFSQRQLQK